MNPDFTARDFRDAVGWFATGVTVITARGGDGAFYGVTANSFASVSLDPPLVLWSLDKRSPSSAGFAAAGHFAVNILAQDQQGLSARFATTGPDKWRDIAHESWQTGAPILPGSLASLDCRVEAKHDGGDHVIYVGRVLRLESRRHGQPLLFSRGSYRALGERVGVAGETPGQRGQEGIEAPELAGLEPWFSA
jgi:flavin reductase (DIM6/NTAB) family NADH-FMN oxidoreductase RutF